MAAECERQPGPETPPGQDVLVATEPQDGLVGRAAQFDHNRTAGVRSDAALPDDDPPAASDVPVGVWARTRVSLAVAAGRVAGALSRRLGVGEGAVIGGRVALMLAPRTLAGLAAGHRTVLVSGTNGKTTTAHLVAAALRAHGAVVAHNETGANMADGAVAAFIARPDASFAVLEVDERHLPRVAAAVAPAVVVLLNLSRDQLDRNAEVTAVSAGIRDALLGGPRTVVVANADDPHVAAAAWDLPEVRWVAGGASRIGDPSSCPGCGAPLQVGEDGWSCPSCGLVRPSMDWRSSGQDVVTPAGRRIPLRLQLPGDFNRRNALMAVAAAAELGVPADVAVRAFADVPSVAHRYAHVRHGRHRLTLLLAKNPAGWREILPLLHDAPARLLVVNAREADGRDTSWLWDVPFEELGPAPTTASGLAAADLGLRLTYAGIEHATEPDPLAALATLPPGDVTVAANYTAFAALWSRLRDGRDHHDGEGPGE